MGDSDVEGAGGGASAGDSAGNTLLTCAEMLSHMASRGVVSAPALHGSSAARWIC